MKKLILIITVMFLVSACSTQSFNVNGHYSKPRIKAEDDMSSFFVYGLGQKDEIDAAQICGGADKISHVEAQQTFLNGFLSFLTMGIYTPRQYRIYCLR